MALDSHSNTISGNYKDYVKRALVIAVSDYDESSGLKSIEFCKNDGQEMYNVLKENGYDIPNTRQMIGYVDSSKLKEMIYKFFTDKSNQPDDTLVFYYSGHGVPDKFGKTFLAPSDMDSEHPFMTGFSFEDLTDAMLASNSLRIVTILDSCFSGSLKIGKGLGNEFDSKSGEEAAARIANAIVEEKSNKLKQGIGRCLLASSQGYEEAYDRQEKDHSIFTYYLLEGLKGHKNAVDDEGNVTYDSLGKFIARQMGNLPPNKRPKQTPLRKCEVSGGEIILASYPPLKKVNLSHGSSVSAVVTATKNLSILTSSPSRLFPSFHPNPLTIREGSLIKVNNDDNVSHTVTSGDNIADLTSGKYFDSDIILANSVVSIDTSKLQPGEYLYYCRLCSHMKGEIIVESHQKIDHQKAKVYAQNHEGLNLARKGEYDKAIELLDECIEISKSIGDPEGEVYALNHKGLTFVFMGEYDKAIELLDECIEISKKNKDPEGEVYALNHKGLAYERKGEYDKAIEIYSECKKLRESEEYRNSINQKSYR